MGTAQNSYSEGSLGREIKGSSGLGEGMAKFARLFYQ